MKRTALLLFLFSASLLGLAGGASADTCSCHIYVRSVYRWIDPWWGLECTGHCGHAHVGSSCDWAHTAGCGAMIGTVRIRHSNGSTIKNLDCPDDHQTCFRGPSGCDDGGTWGNICNADVWHCAPGGYSQGKFDCNALSDSARIHQTYTPSAVFAGACGTNWFNVLEHIVENDVGCCDDPMGYINVSAWTAEGYSSTFLSGGDQNCNGGSQGGVYPFCGKFGATLEVESFCSTTYGESGGGGGGGGGENPPPPRAAAVLNAELEKGIEEQRQALAASLPRRERQLAATPRHVVEAEVAERARKLGMRASAKSLTNLLVETAAAELARDRCRVDHPGEQAPACGDLERRLEQLDDVFQKLSGGVGIREFRSGSTGPPPEPVAPAPRH